MQINESHATQQPLSNVISWFNNNSTHAHACVPRLSTSLILGMKTIVCYLGTHVRGLGLHLCLKGCKFSSTSIFPKFLSLLKKYVIFLGGLLSFSKVLNFFPVGGERECQPSGYHVAKAGICLNAYDCRQRDGQSAGDCAHGLGVCCVCKYFLTQE